MFSQWQVSSCIIRQSKIYCVYFLHFETKKRRSHLHQLLCSYSSCQNSLMDDVSPSREEGAAYGHSQRFRKESVDAERIPDIPLLGSHRECSHPAHDCHSHLLIFGFQLSVGCIYKVRLCT